MKKLVFTLCLVLGFSWTGFTQSYPYEFTELDRMPEYTISANSISDSVVLIWKFAGGLDAYEFDGESYGSYLASSPGCFTRATEVFQETRVVDIPYIEKSIGTRFFSCIGYQQYGERYKFCLLEYKAGQRYNYYGQYRWTDFKEIYRLAEVDSVSISCSKMYSDSIVIAPASWSSTHTNKCGMVAYKYEDVSLTEIAYLEEDGFYASDIEIASDSMIFVANQHLGISAYKFNGSEFTFISRYDSLAGSYNSMRDIALINDSTMVVTRGNVGVSVFNFDGEKFTELSRVEGRSCIKTKIYTDGTIFVTHKRDGMTAYKLVDNQLIIQAHWFNDSYSFEDLHIASNNTIHAAVGDSGNYVLTYDYVGGTSGIEDLSSFKLENFSLDQNYPNPFNPTTTISYTFKKSALVTLKVYDMLGREVAILINRTQEAGNYDISFNASKLSSGVYFYQLQIGTDFIETKKMTVLK